MKEEYTDITFILDKSSSMAHVTGDTIGGFNAFLESQQKEEGKATFTLYQFANTIQKITEGVDINDVKKLNNENYIADGWSTSLRDAVGHAIDATGRRLKNMKEEDRPSKVIIVIQTDGEENSSVEYSWEQLKKMIEHQEDKYNWKFIFLGANLDAAKQAVSLGIASANTMRYANNKMGNVKLYDSMTRNMSKLRKSDMVDFNSMTFFEEKDYEDQKEAEQSNS